MPRQLPPSGDAKKAHHENPYIIFYRERMSELAAQQTRQETNELTKRIAAEWAGMTDAQKSKYRGTSDAQKREAERKERIDKETARLEAISRAVPTAVPQAPKVVKKVQFRSPQVSDQKQQQPQVSKPLDTSTVVAAVSEEADAQTAPKTVIKREEDAAEQQQQLPEVVQVPSGQQSDAQRSGSGENRAPQQRVQNGKYLQFFRIIYRKLQARFPKRTAAELSKATALEWKRQKDAIMKRSKKPTPSSSEGENRTTSAKKSVQKKQRVIEIHGYTIELPRLPIKPFQRFVRRVKDDYFGASLGGARVSVQEFGQKVAERWRELPEDEKKRFNDEYAAEMVQYRDSLRSIEHRYGVVLKRDKKAVSDTESAKRKRAEIVAIEEDRVRKRVKKTPVIAVNNPNLGALKHQAQGAPNKIFALLNREVPYEFASDEGVLE